MPDLIGTVDNASRTHVPKLERLAVNAKPKDNGWKDLKLWRFDGTDLYQWRGRQRMRHPGADLFYAWDDQASEVFSITEVREY